MDTDFSKHSHIFVELPTLFQGIIIVERIKTQAAVEVLARFIAPAMKSG